MVELLSSIIESYQNETRVFKPSKNLFNPINPTIKCLDQW